MLPAASGACSTMRSVIYALSERPFPPFLEWQRAVDGLGLLGRLDLLVIASEPRRPCTARLEMRETTFYWEPVPPGRRLPGVDPDLLAGWPHVIAFRGEGQRIQTTAAAVACVAYAAATGGAVCMTDSTPRKDIASYRRWLDFMVTYDLGREEAYQLRYPEKKPDWWPLAPGTMAVVVYRDERPDFEK